MKQTIKYLITGSLLLTLNACVQFRSPEAEEESTPEVQIQNLEDATIQGEMYLYTGQIMSKEQYLQAVINNVKQDKPVEDTQDVEIHIDQLKFEEGSVLYTMGKNLRLSVKELYANEARLATFPKDQVAIRGADGLAGGHILFAVEKASGNLMIELRGEKAGQGQDGPQPDDSMKGEVGPETKSVGYTNPRNDRWVCSEAANGNPGGMGKKGKQGGVGQRGGDTGTLDLQITDASLFTFKVERIPGEGGIGGIGGRGGRGGEGGPQASCGKHRGVQGPVGPEGERGEPGPEGAIGQLQTYCVTIQGAMTCQD